MLHFRRADAVRQRAESTMGGGVAVAANNRHARQGEALFRANDVDDALTLVALGIIFDTEILGILRKRFHLDTAFLVLDAFQPVGCGWHVMINDGKRAGGRMDWTAGDAQAFKACGLVTSWTR